MPARSPWPRASYEHDAMTPLPTITGRPASRGSRTCSTEAKKASMSTCSTAKSTPRLPSALEHHRGEAPGEVVRVQAQLVDIARSHRAGEIMKPVLPLPVGPARVDAQHPDGLR